MAYNSEELRGYQRCGLERCFAVECTGKGGWVLREREKEGGEKRSARIFLTSIAE
jgi:hypothetical protein